MPTAMLDNHQRKFKGELQRCELGGSVGLYLKSLNSLSACLGNAEESTFLVCLVGMFSKHSVSAFFCLVASKISDFFGNQSRTAET